MPNATEVAAEIGRVNPHDSIRSKYLAELSDLTKRNTILYYSGWLQKQHLAAQGVNGFSLSDADKAGFMSAVHKMDKSKGLDLLLHTPGGDISATESLVDYLHSVFDGDIRAIVPQLAMSAGTMIALSCKSILMGKHSSLGAIDPQIAGMPAHGILEEFETAMREVRADPSTAPMWQIVISKYNPTLVGECQKAIAWADEMVEGWLLAGMLASDPNKEQTAKAIVKEFGDHSVTLNHSRHISASSALSIGVKIEMLEDAQALQEAVLSVHHAAMTTFDQTNTVKLIESSTGALSIIEHAVR